MDSEKKILIIDDEPDMIFLLQSRLEAAGFEVATAGDGSAGLDRARSFKPNLIVLDVMMPTMNGYQVCRELKKDPNTKDIKVIMLTAKSQESDRFWGIETGADIYLTKPFEAADLLSKIHELV